MDDLTQEAIRQLSDRITALEMVNLLPCPGCWPKERRLLMWDDEGSQLQCSACGYWREAPTLPDRPYPHGEGTGTVRLGAPGQREFLSARELQMIDSKTCVACAREFTPPNISADMCGNCAIPQVNISETSPVLRAYLSIEEELGKLDDNDIRADALRDALDVLWNNLSPVEKQGLDNRVAAKAERPQMPE